jgi:hypothetical protein
MVYEEDRQTVLEHAEEILKKIEKPLEHRIYLKIELRNETKLLRTNFE